MLQRAGASAKVLCVSCEAFWRRAVQNWTKAKPDRPDDLEDKSGNGNQVEVLKSVIARGRKRSHGGGGDGGATATVAAGGLAGTGAQGGGVSGVTNVDLQALLSESGGAVDMDAVLSVLNDENRRRRRRCALNLRHGN